jgi:hypothetical protein
MNSLVRSAIRFLVAICRGRCGTVFAANRTASDSLDKLDNRTGDNLVVNTNERSPEPHSAARLRKDVNRIVRHRPGLAHDVFRRKKPADVDAQQVGDLEQPARCDAVCPLLVFLNLLEREPQRFGKRGLAAALHHAKPADLLSDILVDRITAFLRPSTAWHFVFLY